MVVDLGSGNARAFSVFCQSMRDHDMDGLAYAVDVWESDEQRSAEGATPFTTINNFFHTHFRGYAYLLDLAPERALLHFADASVDLLRIDLGRSERPFADLLAAWTPKLKPGAVLLIAGVTERTPVLTALGQRSPVIFPDARGLAATIHGTSDAAGRPHWLLEAIATGDEACKQRLVSFYEHAALHHSLRREILGQGDVFFRKRPAK
jgi:hypothetical protein